MDLISPSKDTSWQTGLKKKTQQSATYRRFINRNKHWLKSERLEEDLPNQWPPKTGRGSNTYFR
jgi:hypothetical protein